MGTEKYHFPNPSGISCLTQFLLSPTSLLSPWVTFRCQREKRSKGRIWKDNQYIRKEILTKFSGAVSSCEKEVIYCLTQKSVCCRKGKNTTLSQEAWISVPRLPHTWYVSLGTSSGLLCLGFLICEFRLPPSSSGHPSDMVLQATNGVMHIQVLCKLKSPWLFSTVCLPVHDKPCLQPCRGPREGTARTNLPVVSGSPTTPA